ncbi:serine hydrolase domain-containing protein [Sphingomonas suaedae]|nr:serine hydrolase [Sphingomonas suaedae]
MPVRLRGLMMLATLTLCAMAPTAAPAIAEPVAADGDATDRLLDFLRSQNSSGVLIVQDGKVLVETYWPPPQTPLFRAFVHGRTADGVLLEDVASQQKSFVAVLVAIARDKGLIDLDQPVSTYIGAGWSRATSEQEAQITVAHLLTMSSGLDDTFAYQAPPGTRFHYNTPVYAVTKQVVAAAAKQPLETITRDWLTGPAGMRDTGWRQRPPALSGIGNATGLVTTPRDTALFGALILDRGVARNGARIVSEASLMAMFAPSAPNPAYGQFWWLNGSAFTIRALAGRVEGPLVPAAPADMIGAFGAFERRLYIVPSRKLIVVRSGAASALKDFDQQFWTRLMQVID